MRQKSSVKQYVLHVEKVFVNFDRNIVRADEIFVFVETFNRLFLIFDTDSPRTFHGGLSELLQGGGQD